MRVHRFGSPPAQEGPSTTLLPLERAKRAKGDDEEDVVYVTASKTFDGPAVYITLSDGPSKTNSVTPSPTSKDEDADPTTAKRPAPTTSAKEEETDKPSPPTKESEKPSSTTGAAEKESSSASKDDPTNSSTKESPEPSATETEPKTDTDADSPTQSDSDSAIPTPTGLDSRPPKSSDQAGIADGQGLSTGAQAGIAIGVVGTVAFLLAILFWLHRKKQQRKAAAAAAFDQETKAAGAGFAPVSGATTGAATAAYPLSEKGSAVSTNMTSPFSPVPTQSQLNPSGAVGGAGIVLNNEQSQISPAGASSVQYSSGPTSHEPTQHSLYQGGPSATYAHQPDASHTQMDNYSTSRDDRTTSYGAYGGASAAAALGAAAAAAAANNNNGQQNESQLMGPPPPVHFVTMNFTPQMKDEMLITHGQHVRLLHEYDDGWALCEHMNPAQGQGVVPRTCLSPQPIPPPRPGTASSSRSAAPFPQTEKSLPQLPVPIPAPLEPQHSGTRAQSSPPRPPRPEETSKLSSVNNSVHEASNIGPSVVLSHSALSATHMPPVPQQTIQSAGLTFPHPPSASSSSHHLPATAYSGPEQHELDGGSANVSRVDPIAPTLPQLSLDFDMGDEGLLGSTSISLTDEGSSKPTSFTVTNSSAPPPIPQAHMTGPVELPDSRVPAGPNPLSPPPLFSDFPRSLSPGPNKPRPT